MFFQVFLKTKDTSLKCKFEMPQHFCPQVGSNTVIKDGRGQKEASLLSFL